MNKCKVCNKPCKGNTCSGACRTKLSRRNSVTPADVTPADVTPADVSLDHYQAHPGLYAHRLAPELLNWGQWLNTDQLKQAGLKANRGSIPGDHDYSGVCVEVDGVWQVRVA